MGGRAAAAALLARALDLDPRPQARARVFRIAEPHLPGRTEPAPLRAFAPLRERPLVSIVIATRNRPRLLADALACVAAQTYTNWEVVLVNDGGEPVEPAARAAMPAMPDGPGDRLRLFAHAESEGPAYARNTGLAEIRGEVVAFLDDDDRLAPRHLQNLVNALAAAGASYCACDIVMEKLEGAARIELSRARQPMPAAFSRGLLLVRNYIPLNCCAFRAEMLGAGAGFDELLPCLEDWELLLRLSGDAEFAFVPEATAEYRMRGLDVRDSVSKTRAADTAAAFARIYGRHASNDPLVAVARAAYRWLVLSGNYATLG